MNKVLLGCSLFFSVGVRFILMVSLGLVGVLIVVFVVGVGVLLLVWVLVVVICWVIVLVILELGLSSGCRCC